MTLREQLACFLEENPRLFLPTQALRLIPNKVEWAEMLRGDVLLRSLTSRR
jgi:hypothetical protein